jgi:hypothetical protein
MSAPLTGSTRCGFRADELLLLFARGQESRLTALKEVAL